LFQQEILKLILELIETQNVNYLKIMNLNLFRYLTQVIEDPVTLRTVHEHQCKCMEESSIYHKQKDQKKKKIKKMFINKMKTS